MEYKSIIQGERLKIFEVADGVFAAISPFRGMSWCNAGFVANGKGMFYDTFFDVPHAQEMLNAYQKVTGRHLPQFVVNSHYNGDHVNGNGLFKDSTIIMHKEAKREHLLEVATMSPEYIQSLLERDKNDPTLTLGEQYLIGELTGFDLRGVEWVDADITIEHDITVQLGNTEAKILSIAPAHSFSDLLLWLPKEKVVFAGDVVFLGCVGSSETGMRRWADALDIIVDLKPDVVVPGHGALCGVEFVQEQKAYIDNLLSEFDKYYTDDITALELAKKIDVSKYLHWIEPERVYPTVASMLKERRGQSPAPDWNDLPVSQAKLRAYHKEKYGDKLQEWDPYSVWKE